MMIQVLEAKRPDGQPIEGVEIPPEIAACGKDAFAYLVIDPSEGRAESRASIEQELRDGYRKACIIFEGNHRLPDGRIVSVGRNVDPLIAEMFTKPR